MHKYGFADSQLTQTDELSSFRKQRNHQGNSSGTLTGGSSMKSMVVKMLLGMATALALALLLNGCGSQPYCPTCGTTVNGAYSVVDVIPVPEHNPTGEPGGPFNSFDISWFDPNLQRDYISDRIGIDVVVLDALHNYAVNTIGGLNEVADGGNNASPCWGPQNVSTALSAIPSLVTGSGSVRMANPANATNVLTRYGCRNAPYFASFSTYFPGYGPNGMFGGFPGAQCCAARANGVNPLSGPDGEDVTPDGKTLFSGTGSASVVVFDLTTNPPVVIADIPTGASPDFDGPAGGNGYGGIANCIESWNGGAGSDPTCGDDRGDELSYGTIGGHDVLAITNGDPALPFVTFIDVTDIINRTNTPPFTLAGGVGPAGGGFGHCLPISYPAYNVVGTTADNYVPGVNPPACIIGQIYYDGASPQSSDVPVDSANGFPCPDPSENVPSGVSGVYIPTTGPLAGTTVTIPCHHAPIVNSNTGAYITNNGTAGAGQTGEIAPAGLGGAAFNPIHGTFYVFNSNSTVSTSSTQASTAVGNIDEVDLRIGNPNGPIVVASIPILNCMPTSMAQGPGTDFLIGCAGHDGTQFPPLEAILDGSTNQIITTIDQVGGVDEVWYNPGDNRYYTASRDMPNGPVMGVIDAATRLWLVNVGTGSNSHSVAANQFTNQIFVPMQAGTRCETQSANGCVAVYSRQ
jgi:hypothetical protein